LLRVNSFKTGVGAAALMLLLTACSGASDRPTSDDLADAIRSGDSGIGVSEDKADCVAQVLVDSDLSDDALRRYTGDNDAEELGEADDKAFNEVLSSIQQRCKVSQGAV
jgi:hypothetical protein